MSIPLSVACSCVYQQCDQDGHSVCPVIADHIETLSDMIEALLPFVTEPLVSPEQAIKARELIAFSEYRRTPS